MTRIMPSDLSPKVREQVLFKLAQANKPKAARDGKPKGGGGSELEHELIGRIRLAGLPAPTREVVFAPPRKWRFDLLWADQRLACEVDGGTRSGGRHVRGDGYEGDCRKGNAAVLLGFRVLHVTGSMVKSGEAVAVIRAALEKGNQR